jgi:PAS domain S-box-containing protein
MVDQPWTLVMVDDAAELRQLVKTALKFSGRFTVVGEGSDGREAIELAGRLRPDVLLLDVSMPEVDGLEALPKVLAAAPDTKVVMYTGFNEAGLAARAQELGAAALLEKSLPLERLADTLAEIRAAASPRRATRPDVKRPDERESERGDAAVLDEHLERFREVFEEAAIGMATMTLAGHIVRANKALAALVGDDPDRLVGMPYVQLAAPDEETSVSEGLRKAQEGSGKVVQVEHWTAPAAPLRRRLLATAAPVRDSHNRPLYLFLQVQDVTAQRSAEEALRQSEERFRLLVEAVQDYAIFMLDPDGVVVSWNAGAQRIQGYTATEAIGQHFRVFYPQDKQEIRHPEHELELAIANGHYEEEGWRVRKDGTMYWASVLITAVYNQSGEHVGFAKVTRDIDERREMQLELENSAEALTRANADLASANENLSREAADQAQFLAVTAHELRTPVTVLSGGAKMLADHWEVMTESDRAELFESIRSSADRLQRLLSDLLTAARLESRALQLQMQPVDVCDVLTRAVATARTATSGSEIVVQCPGELTVQAEPERIAQAVDNLITNALRHGVPPVQVAAIRRGDRIEIEVSDRGPGVADEVQGRLFQRFSTGGRRKGTGLGLFIVRELARAHGGDAWYVAPDAEPGRFVISLPAADAQPAL